MLVIRQERESDYEQVYNIVKAAFALAEHNDGNEQDLIINLRKSKAFIPELSLVAILDNKVVGYILFTKIKIRNHEELALAPLAVLPQYQKNGIGSKLVEEGHKIANKLGYHYSVVLGSESYYTKFGYKPAENFGIQAPFKVDSKNFMAIKLNNVQTDIKGIVEYAEEFGI